MGTPASVRDAAGVAEYGPVAACPGPQSEPDREPRSQLRANAIAFGETRERERRDELAEAFIRGFQVGAEHPDDSGDGDAMYQHFRNWKDAE